MWPRQRRHPHAHRSRYRTHALLHSIPKGVVMLLWDRHFLLPPLHVTMRECCNWKFSRAPGAQSFPVAQRARRQNPVVHRERLELEQLVTRNPLQTQRELMIKKKQITNTTLGRQHVKRISTILLTKPKLLMANVYNNCK